MLHADNQQNFTSTNLTWNVKTEERNWSRGLNKRTTWTRRDRWRRVRKWIRYATAMAAVAPPSLVAVAWLLSLQKWAKSVASQARSQTRFHACSKVFFQILVFHMIKCLVLSQLHFQRATGYPMKIWKMKHKTKVHCIGNSWVNAVDVFRTCEQKETFVRNDIPKQSRRGHQLSNT